MPEPITTITVLKQLKDSLPTIKSAWSKVTEADEREAGERLILFMEGKRIFDFTSFEVPYGCYQSSQAIIGEVEKERAKLPNDAFKKLLLDLINVCNKFKTSVERLNLSESKQWEAQLDETERATFIEALGLFRYEIGAQVAAMGEAWHLEVPQKLIPYDLMRSLFPQLKTRD